MPILAPTRWSYHPYIPFRSKGEEIPVTLIRNSHLMVLFLAFEG